MAAYRGADAVVVSAHKTLPAMGQSALLLTRGVAPELVLAWAGVLLLAGIPPEKLPASRA